MTIAAIVIITIVIVIIAVMIYPGEMSQVSPGSNRWLYDRASRNYENKWESGAYHDAGVQKKIAAYARRGIEHSGISRVLDLGCGTGRGIRIVAPSLPTDTQFTGIDFSAGMLQQFRTWLNEAGGELSGRVTLIESDLGSWAKHDSNEKFGSVFLMEVGEFLPEFEAVMEHIAQVTSTGAELVMTRPAGAWCWCFPGRRQSRNSLTTLLASLNFESPEFVPWRSRYELVFSRRR